MQYCSKSKSLDTGVIADKLCRCTESAFFPPFSLDQYEALAPLTMLLDTLFH